MSSGTTDILQKLETHQIIELKTFYEGYKDEFPQICSYLKTVLKWTKTHPEYVTIYSVDGDFIKDGTFIAVNTFYCYDIVLHSLEESCEKICRGLTETKLINWRNDYGVLFYAMHARFESAVLKSLKDINILNEGSHKTYLWSLTEEQALEIDDTYDDNEFYIDKIKPVDAELINSVWPNHYETSLEYLRIFIIMNGGYGMYEKGSGKLVAWVLQNILGQIGVLQTLDGYFQRGFGSILTKKLAKDIAQNEDHPLGTVHDGNIASEALFLKLGFTKKFACVYLRTIKKE